MNTPQSHLLLSPNGSSGQQHQFASLDPYDTASNHSGHSSSQRLQTAETTYSDTNLSAINASSASSATIPAGQPAKKNFNSEYKSKFRPFSQYAYNEVTDSFVKQPSAANSISASRSNQDLSGGADAHQITTISAHEADVFEPTNGQIEGGSGGGGAGAATVEPWYKEVQKRNEKAHEYRFKSEVGHNSPLLNYNRSDSPFCQTEQQITSSPSGNESMIGESSNLNEVRSQHSDQFTTEGNHSQEQQASKAQYRFTPYDYKRDNLIAHMANNNNFNLPKEQLESGSSSKVQPRRLMSSSTASSRARSQSSRRQPATGAGASTTTSKAQPASKSNQATPTRSIGTRSNVTMRAATASSATKTAATASSATKTTPTSRYATTTRAPASRPTAANGSSGLSSSTTKTPTQTSSASKRTPTVSASRITPKQVSSSVSSSTKTTPLSSAKKTAAVPSAARPALSASSRPKTAAPTRPASSSKLESPTKTALSGGIKPGKLPNPNAWLPSSSTRTTPVASKEKTMTPKTAGASSAVKSIKTRKAIESETAKKAAAAAAAAAAGVAVAAAVTAAAVAPSNQEEPTVAPVEPIIDQEQVQANLRYAPEEQNLIFTTTEAGDMLADELAQAELAASSSGSSRPEQQAFVQEEHQQPVVEELATLIDDGKIDKPGEESQTGELINGLAGGLVSAEDRFDSSERDCSVDTTNEANHSSMQQEQNFNDEPYSIIPTSADHAEVQQFEAETSSEMGDLTYIKAPDSVGDPTALQDDKDSRNNPSEIGESTHEEPPPGTVDHTDLLHESHHGENHENFGGDRGGDVSDDAINTSGAAALTEDQEFMVLSPSCTDNLNKEDGKPGDELLLAGEGTSSKSNDNDLTHGESEDIIDSSPALISANTTLQGDELDLSATSNPPNADASPSSNDNNNSNTNVDSETNLVQLALETHDVEVSRHELDSETLQNDDVAEFGETSGSVNSLSFSGFESSRRDELLMNVADLVDAESRKKQEMARKSELAKRDSSPIPAGDIGEVLLSPLQLNDQFAALSVDDEAALVRPDDASNKQFNNSEDLEGKQNEKFDADNERSQIIQSQGSDIMNFDHDDNSTKHDEFKGNDDLFGVMGTGSDGHDNFSQAADATFNAGLNEAVESDQVNQASNYTETITPKASQVNLDDIDNDEHLKLSNHLTNSDDELILQPGNQKSINEPTSSAQHVAGESDLDLMAEEDRIEGTVELADGTSAALDAPTSVENRVEMSTSKSTDEPELPQANFKFARKMSDDSDEELDINPDDDPIGSAATLSPNTSVAEELMRFNAVKDNILDLAMARITDDEHFSEMTSSNDRVHNNNGSTKDTIESVNVTSHVIDETVKQLSEQ